MSDSRFADRVDAVDYLVDELGKRIGVDTDAVRIFAEQAVDIFRVKESDSAEPNFHRVVIHSRRWVIRNQDLAIMDLLGGILQGTTTGAAVYFTAGSAHSSLIAPAVAVLVQVLKVGVAVRNKGVQLSECDFKLLMLVVESIRGITAQDIFAVEENRTLAPDVQSLEAALEHLAKYPTSSGDIALIWKGAGGLWHPKDL